MKITKEKLTDYLSGKGFYLVLATCLIAVGVTAGVAYIDYNAKPGPVGEISSKETPSIISSNEEVSSELQAGTDVSEPYSSQESSSEEEIYLDIVAEEFSFPVSGEVIKEFSSEELKYSKTYKDMRIHEGVDISCDEEAVVVSTGKGLVTSVTTDSELGIVVEIDHGNGIIAYYCGLLEELNVKEGDVVNENTILGLAGTVPGECEDEPHVHLEFYKDGKLQNPMDFISY